jgi:MFS family permease
LSPPHTSPSSLLDHTIVKVTKRLVPFLLLMYVLAFLDRANIGFAKKAFQLDTGLSDAAYALGAGIFFIGYAVFEIPSNLIMHRIGARIWMCRIMVTWGLISAALMFAHTETLFYVLRFLLGVAEAGFFPGVILITAAVTLAVAGLGIAASTSVGSPLLALVALCFAAAGFIAVQPLFWTFPTGYLAGTAAAGGIALINSLGALGGFVAPNVKTWAEKSFASGSAGLFLLAGTTLIGSVLILGIKYLGLARRERSAGTIAEFAAAKTVPASPLIRHHR